MPTALLPDGREVDTSSEEWRLHCLAQHRQRQVSAAGHVQALARMTGAGSRQSRADYLAAVRRADGDAMADAVHAAFLEHWAKAHPPRQG